jgi:hypothetical protein
MSKWWIIMISCEQIIRIINHSWRMGISFWQFRWPNSTISIFSLMNCKIRSPDSIMNNTLTEVPFLEVVSLVFLMSWMNFRWENHFIH